MNFAKENTSLVRFMHGFNGFVIPKQRNSQFEKCSIFSVSLRKRSTPYGRCTAAKQRRADTRRNGARSADNALGIFVEFYAFFSRFGLVCQGAPCSVCCSFRLLIHGAAIIPRWFRWDDSQRTRHFRSQPSSQSVICAECRICASWLQTNNFIF